MEKSIARFPVEYWDGLTEKKDLYEKIEGLPPEDKNFILVGNYILDKCYKDSEFKEVAEKLETAAKPLRALLQDIENHYSSGENYKKNAQAILDKINLDNNLNIALLALLVCKVLDGTGKESFINRIRTGNGIPEERAAHRAAERYQAFKAEDAARLKAFKETPEYALQEAELKFKRRDKIEIPEE